MKGRREDGKKKERKQNRKKENSRNLTWGLILNGEIEWFYFVLYTFLNFQSIFIVNMYCFTREKAVSVNVTIAALLEHFFTQ